MTDNSEKKKNALDEFVKRAKKRGADKIEKIILFGSVARGDCTEESDVDVLVNWNGKTLEGWDCLEEIATDVLIEHGVLISLKIITPRDYDTMKELRMPFIENIEQEGVILG
jgi:predicted nucleotidyltransferase